MDNASYHNSYYTKAVILNLKLSVAYNIPTTPQLKTIELVFA